MRPHPCFQSVVALAVCVATATIALPQRVEAQLPRAWATLSTGYGHSASGHDLVSTDDLTVELRVRDSTAVTLSLMGSQIPNRPTDSLTHPTRTLVGFVASVVFPGHDLNAFGDRLGQTLSIGLGTFRSLTGTDTTTWRPGGQLGIDVPIFHSDPLGDMAVSFLTVAIPEARGHWELTSSVGLTVRVF